jgi:hypothetical protein
VTAAGARISEEAEQRLSEVFAAENLRDRTLNLLRSFRTDLDECARGGRTESGFGDGCLR